MTGRAYDQQHPSFLRLPTLETLIEGMDTFFPGPTPAEYDDSGEAVYTIADLARALEASEAELLQHADQRGLADRIQREPVHWIH